MLPCLCKCREMLPEWLFPSSSSTPVPPTPTHFPTAPPGKPIPTSSSSLYTLENLFTHFVKCIACMHVRMCVCMCLYLCVCESAPNQAANVLTLDTGSYYSGISRTQASAWPPVIPVDRVNKLKTAMFQQLERNHKMMRKLNWL